MRSSLVDKEKWDPEDKGIVTPEGYKVILNNDRVLIESGEEKTWVEVEDDSLNIINDDNAINMDGKGIKVSRKDGSLALDNSKAEIGFKRKGVKITAGGIDLF